MNKSLGTIFWIEAVLGTLTGVLAVITPFFPDWIEAISGWTSTSTTARSNR